MSMGIPMPTVWSEMHLAADQYDGLSIDTGAGSGISSKDASGCHDDRRQSDKVYRTCHQELGQYSFQQDD